MNRTVRITIAGLISLAAFRAVQILPSSAIPRNADAVVRAGRIMEQAIRAVRFHRDRVGAMIDTRLDPNRTGLIGPESSPLTTTVGDLEAKRSTTNPNMAGLIVWLLDRAGARPGDSIAVGSSGSFPALLVATLSAAKAMDLHPISIISLGASSYGAADPDFTLLEIHDLLRREGICSGLPAAVSLGGGEDVGSDLEPDIRERLIARIKTAGVPFFMEPDLRRNAARRMQIYRSAASGRIAAFVNCGGGFANLGTSRLALAVRPGLNKALSLPPPEERGVLFDMAAGNIPVIHLLFIKGLVMESGLPWDPIPLPAAGLIHPPGAGGSTGFWSVAIAYFVLLFLLAVIRR